MGTPVPKVLVVHLELCFHQVLSAVRGRFMVPQDEQHMWRETRGSVLISLPSPDQLSHRNLNSIYCTAPLLLQLRVGINLSNERMNYLQADASGKVSVV